MHLLPEHLAVTEKHTAVPQNIIIGKNLFRQTLRGFFDKPSDTIFFIADITENRAGLFSTDTEQHDLVLCQLLCLIDGIRITVSLNIEICRRNQQFLPFQQPCHQRQRRSRPLASSSRIMRYIIP